VILEKTEIMARHAPREIKECLQGRENEERRRRDACRARRSHREERRE
jgi:hypothetical protein